MNLKALIEEARIVIEPPAGLSEFAGGTKGAADYLRAAQKRGDRKAVAYWTGRLPKKSAGKKQKGFFAQVGAAVKGAVKGTVQAVKSAGKAIKDLPKNVKRFVTDAKFRKKVGKKLASAVRRKAKAAIDHVMHEAHEFKVAGKALAKLATLNQIDKKEKHALKAAAKTLAMTLVGTVAMGGLGHLTIGALATHFAAETAIKSVGKAALFASADLYEGEEATLRKWAEHVAEGIAQGFEGLHGMSEEEIMALIPAEEMEPSAETKDGSGDHDFDD